jgi:cytochrome c oxidase subunit 2
MRLGKSIAVLTAMTVGLFTTVAYAASEPWQLGFQAGVTPVMEKIAELHDLLFWIITVVTIFVMFLLAYTVWRFSEKRNPVPSKTTHNTMIEMLWTVVPVIILVVIAVPSFKLLYMQDVIPKADLTIKATGSQWYWSYEYPDHGKFEFDSNMIPDDELKPGQKRLLETDNSVVVPVNATVRVLVAAGDVLHSWAVPAFGVKIDAVPGRLNQTWFKATREGTYYGQCSELCGVNHGFMPIQIEVVSQAKFDIWVAAKRKAAGLDNPARKIAQLDN